MQNPPVQSLPLPHGEKASSIMTKDESESLRHIKNVRARHGVQHEHFTNYQTDLRRSNPPGYTMQEHPAF
jgi:hypothetical protein